MKRSFVLTTTLSLLLLSLTAFSINKSKVITKPVNVSYVQFPAKPIHNKQDRTYKIKAQLFTYRSAYNEDKIISSISIDQLKKIQTDDAYLHAYIEFSPLSVTGVNKRITKKKVKTKEGKVYVDTYYYAIDYQISAKLINKVDKGKRMDGSYTYGGKKQTFKTNTFDTEEALSNYYKMQANNIQAKLKNEFIQETLKTIKKRLNDDYGYQKIQMGAQFYVMKKPKHKAYNDFEDAFNSVNRVFASMRYDEPTAFMEEELNDAILMYEKLAKKYKGDKKKTAKVRFAALYNLATLYYYFDDFAKAKEYTNKIINTNPAYGGNRAKGLLRSINKSETLVKINGVQNRHMELD